MLAWLGVAAFLVLFAVALVSWQRRMPFLWVVVPLAMLGSAYAHYTYTAVVFICYAACIVPWAVDGNRLATTRYTLLLVGVLCALGNRSVGPELRNWYWVVCPVFCITCSMFFAWVVRTCLQVNRLAKLAERERIARDLHDVLGHTLSLIALKTELAGRQLSQNLDGERARAEVLDVETISRQALADVQQTILGDRPETLEEELERARVTLLTAGILLECQREPLKVDAVQESILGFALREAVTNIVRHAHATRCRIRLQQSENGCVLEVQDDGCGIVGTRATLASGASPVGALATSVAAREPLSTLPATPVTRIEVEGEGLRGMRERVEAIGGSVLREVSAGTRVLIRLPMPVVAA